MPGDRAEPGIDGVDGFRHRGEVAALNDFFGEPQPLVGDARLGIPDGDGGRDVGHARHVRAKLLQGHKSEEHTSELQSLMRISYAVYCLNKKRRRITHVYILPVLKHATKTSIHHKSKELQ